MSPRKIRKSNAAALALAIALVIALSLAACGGSSGGGSSGSQTPWSSDTPVQGGTMSLACLLYTSPSPRDS